MRRSVIITSAVALLVAAPIAAGVPSGVLGSGDKRERATATQAKTSYDDPQRGVSALLPAGWHAAAELTSLTFPREVITLASYPLRRGGSCGPDRALADLPSDGALIFVFEYRPDRGAVWTGSRRRESFPPRPAHVRLPRRASEGFRALASPAICCASATPTVRSRSWWRWALMPALLAAGLCGESSTVCASQRCRRCRRTRMRAGRR